MQKNTVNMENHSIKILLIWRIITEKYCIVTTRDNHKYIYISTEEK
jgi:hypothetical protein